MLWNLYKLCCLNVILVTCIVVCDVSCWRVSYVICGADPIETGGPIQHKINEKNFYFPEDSDLPSLHEYHPTMGTTILTEPPPDYTAGRSQRNDNFNEKFSSKLYSIMAAQYSSQNLIYSPLSLQSLLAILYIGAENTTATQLQEGLELPQSVPKLLQKFESILSETERTSKDFQLNFAQKLYFKDEYVLLYGIEDIAKNYFKSEVAPMSFDSTISAAENINHWVSQKTHDHIRNVVAPDSFDDETELVLVNVIYLKAKWAREFSVQDTLKQDFYIGNQAKSIPVDMMYNEDDFLYGDFPELDAKIVELPFVDSELSMLIILPNELDGLVSLENQLRTIANFNQLLEKMEYTSITLRIPKFKIESDLNMEDPLKQLGIHNIFTNDSELGKLFSSGNAKVSKILHKAFIDVNEGGVEAAAATFVQIVPLSLQPKMVYFTADHPFMFAIRSPQAVYFIGHVINNFQ